MQGVSAAFEQNPTLRIVAIAVVAVVAIVVLVLVVRGIGGALSQGSEPVVEESAESSSGVETVAYDGDPSLAWRNEEFPVDPDRQDWSTKDNGRKVVYLTIDDGPSELTQAFLDMLDQYNAKATFFVTGHDPDYYHLIKEAYDRGHTIGLHTMTHDYEQVYASEDAYFQDLDEIGQVVKDQIGYVPCFIRFPGGSSNSISSNYSPGLMPILMKAVQERGYQYYDWNVSSGDGGVYSADELYNFSTEGDEHETNIMLLCHDSATKQTTLDALPRIIEFYQKLGYSFEAIDRSTWVCHHGVPEAATEESQGDDASATTDGAAAGETSGDTTN